MRFSCNGTNIGNEYSTFSNPWGIINRYDYNVIADMVQYLGVKSSRQYLTKDSVEKFYNYKMATIAEIKQKIDTLKSMPYELSRKIEIDNYYVRLHALEVGIRYISHCTSRCVYKTWCRQRIDPHTPEANDVKFTVASFAKQLAEILVQENDNSRYDKGFNRKVTEVYNDLIGGIGARAEKASNIYLD